MLPIDAGPTLLRIARASIAHALGREPVDDENAAWLLAPGACFVTLSQHGRLRGCIGTLQPYRSLSADVKANAVAAALQDSRFAPLPAAELARTEVEVSLLSPMQPMHFASEANALAQLQPGIDGVVLQCRGRRSTFLPQVWEQLPGRAEFVAQLKAKAGLPASFWSDDVRLQRYTVTRWKESNPPVGRVRDPAARAA